MQKRPGYFTVGSLLIFTTCNDNTTKTESNSMDSPKSIGIDSTNKIVGLKPADPKLYWEKS